MTTLLTTPETTKAEGTTATPAVQDASKGSEQQATKAETPPIAKEGDVGKPTPPPDAPKGAPEKYEFKPSAGREFDPEVLKAYSGVARELNLTQEAAQTMLDRVAPVLETQQKQQVETILKSWTDEVQADKTFGGEAGKANLAIAKKALNAIADPELNKLLDLPDKGGAGLGDNLAVIRLFHWIGTRLSEDKFIAGNGASATREMSLGEILRPGLK